MILRRRFKRQDSNFDKYFIRRDFTKLMVTQIVKLQDNSFNVNFMLDCVVKNDSFNGLIQYNSHLSDLSPIKDFKIGKWCSVDPRDNDLLLYLLKT